MQVKWRKRIVFFSFIILLFSCQENKHYQKPSIRAGYKSGTLFDVNLLVYSDSTFYYSNSDKERIGKWMQLGDTLILKQNGNIQAIMVNYEPILINNPRYNWLNGMKFIENNPPKIVKFPKHN